MKKHYLQYLGDRGDADYGAVSAMTIDEILDEINRDHSSQWTDYNKNDWREGLAEWTYYVPPQGYARERLYCPRNRRSNDPQWLVFCANI